MYAPPPTFLYYICLQLVQCHRAVLQHIELVFRRLLTYRSRQCKVVDLLLPSLEEVSVQCAKRNMGRLIIMLICVVRNIVR